MTAANLDWMAQAECRTVPGFTELPQLEQGYYCSACPVRLACTEFGLAEPIPATGNRGEHTWPLYGGLAPAERRSLRRARQRAAQRKAAAA